MSREREGRILLASWSAAARPAVLAATVALAAGLLALGPASVSEAFPHRASPGPWSIGTAAGGVGGPAPARKVYIGAPCGVAFSDGRLYVGSNGLVRRVSLRTGWLTTPAGTVDVTGEGPSGISARGAGLGPCGLAADHHGNLVIADIAHDQVRVVASRTGSFYGQPMIAGHIYTIAGTGTAGYAGDGGAATNAELSGPAGVAVDQAGNVVVADTINDRVRVIAATTGTFYGLKMTAGDIYTVAGTGSFGYTGDGGPAVAATLSLTPQNDGKEDLSGPWPVVRADHAGNLVLGDINDCHVRVIAGRTGSFYGQHMTAGDIYTIAGEAHQGCGFSGDRGPATSARLGVVSGIAVDGAGNIVVSDQGNVRIRLVAVRSGRFYGRQMTAGDIYTVAGSGRLGSSGDGGPANRAKFAGPTGVAVDSAGNLLIADGQGYGENGAYFRNTRVQAVAVRPGRFYGRLMTAGHIYTIAGTRSPFTGNGGLATHAQINATSFGIGIALDAHGNLLIPDAGRILAVAARSGRFYGQAMRARHLYSVAGGGRGFPGGGRRAAAVRLTDPTAVTTDAAGNVLMAVYGARRLSVLAARTGRFYGQQMTAGRVYWLAGNGNYGISGIGGPALKAAIAPTNLAVDHHGNVVIADSPDLCVALLAARTGTFFGQKMTAGHLYRLSGTAVGEPGGVAVDAAGNVIVANRDASRVQVIAARTGTFYGEPMTAGHRYTIAGNGTFADSGDGGPALQASVEPTSVAVDAAGNVIITDAALRIRVVAVRTGTFYGQQMTAGDIYRIAGGGTRGLGDGGPALRAEFTFPTGVAVARSGAVYFADAYRVRVISP